MVKTHIAPLKSVGQRVSRVSVHVYASSLHIKTWNTCISHVYIQIDTERIALCHVKNGRKEGNEWAFEFHRRTRMIWLAKNRNVHLTKDLLVRRFLCYTVNICRHACKSLKSQWKFLSNAGTHDHIPSLSLQITTKKKLTQIILLAAMIMAMYRKHFHSPQQRIIHTDTLQSWLHSNLTV